MKNTALDQLFSQCIRLAAGRCEAEGVERLDCGEVITECSGPLQCCHLHSRKFSGIRVDPLNAISMCAGHHQWFTDHPVYWGEFIESTLGRAHVDLLLELRQERHGFQWKKDIQKEARAHYRSELKRLQEERDQGSTEKLRVVGYL